MSIHLLQYLFLFKHRPMELENTIVSSPLTSESSKEAFILGFCESMRSFKILTVNSMPSQNLLPRICLNF